MPRRFLCVAIVLVASLISLIAAAPAFAANGARADYTTSNGCAVCHTSGQPAGAPKVYNDWATTAHGTDAEAAGAAAELPYGSVCAGCHTANFDPSKVTPTPTATSTAGAVTWEATVPSPMPSQATGDAAFSEFDIGCSSCHYGSNMNGVLAGAGNDANDTAHTAPYQDLANAEICGACHSRYAYTVNTIAVTPVPYVSVDPSGTPIPNPKPTSLIQPQMAIGYPMLGTAYQPLSAFLNVATPGWTPTPNPSATSAAGLQQYWTYNGQTTVWPSMGHDGDAGQYAEWLSSGHANSLTDLKAAVGANPPASCLQCHSADYRIAVAAGSAVPTGSQAKYGDTCVACHEPHPAASQNTGRGVWDSALQTQLIGDPSNPSSLCTTCHTAQITTSNGVASPGTTMYNNQNETMDGTGAIGVPQGLPGVHNGKCVQCHMVPTTSGYGGIQKGGNHTMQIVYPKVAASATVGSTTGMPYSACTTCHSRTTPTMDTDAVWLQDTIDQRQAAMHNRYDKTAADLHAAGLRLGYQEPASGVKNVANDPMNSFLRPKHTSASATDDINYVDWLNKQLNAKGSSSWSSGELTWQKGFTDWTFIAAEGSWGIHNWQYDSLVITAADNYANQVATTPQTVTLKASHTMVKRHAKVRFSGTVKPASSGKIIIQRKKGKNWLKWKTAKVNAKGHFSLKIKMNRTGTYRLRAFYKAKAPFAGGHSKQIKVIVKK
jgi:hypothetical protein